jgi:hypothetical protein
VGREIPSAECGENRVSRYPCPADCPFNPFSPANYLQYLEFERAVDEKAIQRLAEGDLDVGRINRAMEKARKSDSGHAEFSVLAWELHLKRDKSGLTFLDRWEETGFANLKNDERVLLRARKNIRVSLLEVRRVLDDARTEVVDLLAADGAPFIVQDMALAATAPRFGVYLVYRFPLPHYHRLFGAAIMLPDMGSIEPTTIAHELVRHLGGPADGIPMLDWLAEHLARFEEALHATAHARRRKMFSLMDAEFGRATYKRVAGAEECRTVLATRSDIDLDQLSHTELEEGISRAWIWFDDQPPAVIALPEGGQPSLGRILEGDDEWRIEAMGAARLARLRERFEALMGERMRFVSADRDDIGSRFDLKEPAYDASLVPPSLLEEVPRLVMTASRAPIEAVPDDPDEAGAAMMAAQDRLFLGQPVPALDGRTPREAAGDPLLRPKLIRMLKNRVRAHDEQNLRTGRTDDINWMLRELGADEILFEPPPARAPVSLDSEPGEADSFLGGTSGPVDPTRPAAPRLPNRALTIEEASARLDEALAAFDKAADGLAELEASGSTLIPDVSELTDELLNDSELNCFVPLLLQAWFARPAPRVRRFGRDFRTRPERVERRSGSSRPRSAPAVSRTRPAAGDHSTARLAGLPSAENDAREDVPTTRSAGRHARHAQGGRGRT